ncbi:hypothetical protein CKAH01_10249 [Colletotrichum kahawae]|uniref:Uncharacterized protein n=1 Tax=Colletotrichum kahawae TaxID=34407 RepID=A0AAE0CXG8_COLKA|nr:hypothetical protein CKAH01_10249 [Colletotrichum kahawae]
MDPPQQRHRRHGQSRRLAQRTQGQVRQRRANPTQRVIRGQQQPERSPSNETAGRRESITSGPWMPSTSADFGCFVPSDGGGGRSRHEVQDLSLTSITSIIQELQNKLSRPIEAMKTAVARMEEENEKRFKTTSWFLEQMEFRVNCLAISVEAIAGMPTDWDGTAGPAGPTEPARPAGQV